LVLSVRPRSSLLCPPQRPTISPSSLATAECRRSTRRSGSRTRFARSMIPERLRFAIRDSESTRSRIPNTIRLSSSLSALNRRVLDGAGTRISCARPSRLPPTKPTSRRSAPCFVLSQLAHTVGPYGWPIRDAYELPLPHTHHARPVRTKRMPGMAALRCVQHGSLTCVPMRSHSTRAARCSPVLAGARTGSTRGRARSASRQASRSRRSGLTARCRYSDT
jgi:hypothetical protein